MECAILALNVRRINNLFARRAYLGRFGYERVVLPSPAEEMGYDCDVLTRPLAGGPS